MATTMTDNDKISLALKGYSKEDEEKTEPLEERKDILAFDGDHSNDLRVRLELLKRRYEDELSSFNEYKIEHVLKNSGAKEYLDRVREKERANIEIIASLREELDSRRKEVELWRSKCQAAEKQCSAYWKAWKDAQVRREQLEAERAALEEEKERQLVMSKSMNFSCASSLVDQSVPPPPPINVPSVEEIMKLANTSASAHHSHLNTSTTSQILPNMSNNSNQSLSSNLSGHHYSSSTSLLHGFHNHNNSSSIASPPPMVDFSGANLVAQFHQTTTARSSSSTNGSGSNGGGVRFNKNGTTGVGGRYGRVFNSRSGGLA